jgi:hypothetical protein
MATGWKVTYNLDAEVYAPLQRGIVSNIRLKNLTDKKMVITNVKFQFDWMGTYAWHKSCNIKVGPNKATDLPNIGFTVELSALPGSHNCRIGISYMLLEKDEWNKYGEYEPRGEFIEIRPLPKKDYTVFVSHSNSPDDAQMIRDYKDAMDTCGITKYFAEDDINPGGSLWGKIIKKISLSDAIMVLWTKEAAKSGDVREEIGIAMGYTKQDKIIPIVEQGIEVNGSLKALGIEWINYIPPNHQHALNEALTKIMQWAIDKEKMTSSFEEQERRIVGRAMKRTTKVIKRT